ncbi:Dopey, N-terminal-domain-containing protein [Radiomyces spectabilis]|uniref:Dopey, N-terminal-domain-containing protein n=1 Tax=Radiomyces spectabilis TaxID=64574 RepID=UPI0022207FDD|nr:Dopey, N-terminal-domain-containing protein [Radiomyces spectabilis]KAI8375993.1 Dopey, N-terminal-domain-containing protein [Radiomyces spectabilis]
MTENHASSPRTQQLSISQKLLKKMSMRSLGDHSDSGESSNMEFSPTTSSTHLDALDNPSHTSLQGSSDRSSPRSPSSIKATIDRQSAKEQAYYNDPRFRKYVQLIEKNLASFDAVNEWADIISFLGRLLKSFQAYPQFPVIPNKLTVAKRLAQCLNPGFPAGVHQKTLEVYSYILKTIGPDQLADDLALWSTGLFPFVQHAATHVKPQLLAILEKFYFPLRGKLRPAMRGFVMALLPALEEEGSEFFDKVVSLMDYLSNTVELPFFYSCIWLVMINNANLRPPALNYLLRRLPKIVEQEDVAVVLGTVENVSLMARAFSATLSDPQILVQRGMLELLVQNLSLKHRTIPFDDLVTLMRAALSIVLRKDMSLNRRLYAWLLGTETTSQAQLVYFHAYAEKSATQAIRGLLFSNSTDHHTMNDSSIADAQRPYKIMISLMDKWEIGQPIVSNIFIDALTSLRKYTQRSDEGSEILQTANMWMEMVEPYLIGLKLFETLDTSFPGKTSLQTEDGVSRIAPQANLDAMCLVEFSLQSFKLTDDEMKRAHLPLILASLTRKLQDVVRHPSFIDMLPHVIKCLSLILLVLQLLPTTVFVDRDGHQGDTPPPADSKQFVPGMNVLDYAREFYGLRGPHRRTASNALTNSAVDEREMDTVEDEGDLSTTQTKSNPSLNTPANRTAYGAVRGTVLVKELTTSLTSFMSELVNSYIVVPDRLNTGIDVGVDGKRLRHIDAQLERVLHHVCSIVTSIAQVAGQQSPWSDGHGQQLLFENLLQCCQQGRGFGVVDAGLSTLSTLAKYPLFMNGLVTLHQKSVVKCIMDKLWGFLSPSTQLLHVRTVELIWLLADLAPSHHIETFIVQSLIVPDDTERTMSYEKFGILWGFSDNTVKAATIFSRPMFVMLDLLKEGVAPLDKWAGESWIRCHLGSYVRLLEPFLSGLLDKSILRRAATLNVPYEYQVVKHGTNEPLSIPYYRYLRSFDTAIVDYLFLTLINLVQFGGLNALKAFKHHTVDVNAPSAAMIEPALGISVTEEHTSSPLSYLELIVRIALRFLGSEPMERQQQSMLKPIRSIQLHAAELLYSIISKLEHVDMKITQLMQESVLQKLLFCIATGNLELQQKLLHLLHATMSITAAGALGPKDTTTARGNRHNRRLSSVDQTHSDTMERFATNEWMHRSHPNQLHTEAVLLARATAGIYVKCATDALMMASNRPMLQHWIDFVLATLPLIRAGFRSMMAPILIAVCEQIMVCQTTVRLMMHGDHTESQGSSTDPFTIPTTAAPTYNHKPTDSPLIRDQPATSGNAENDLVMFLYCLEKMVMFSLNDRSISDEWYPGNQEEGTHLCVPIVDDHSALKGLVQMVYNDESSSSNASPRDTILFHLPVILHLLLDVYRVFETPSWSDDTSDFIGDARQEAILHSFAYHTHRVKARLDSIFMRLYKHCTIDFVEGFTEIFFMENPIALEYEISRDQYDLVAIRVLSSTPSSSPQHIVSTLLDAIRQRTPGMPMSRRRSIQRSGKLTDTSIMRFTEIYCDRLIEPEPLAHIWPLIHSFAKDYLSQASAYKTFLPGLLRLLTVTLDGLTRSTALEDKKLRKDAQDLYQRCVDCCILIAGRSFDQSLWLRRSTVHEEDDTASTSSDILSLSDTIMSDVPRNLSTSNVSDLEKKASWKAREDMMIAQVNVYLASTVIPHLRQLIGDQDKINSLLNNLVYYVVGPALRTRTMVSKISVILDQICEMTKMPFTYRAWRKEIWEVFIDNRFFYMSPMTARKWKTIIQTVFSLEKERFTELIARISTTPSTAFFTNKEQETVNRALNLRRLSYVIFCGTTDQHILQLPLIQEKIVELLKLEHSEMVHVEIYLCLRIMLVRFSQKHLLNFWPVLVTELMRLFNAFLSNNAIDRPEEAQIALAGCKYLDLLCTLEIDAFQIYQWIFIRDTVESLIQESEEGPIPIMDRMEAKLQDSPTTDESMVAEMTDGTPSVPSMGQLKRPMLTMHSIGSIRQLSFFIEHIGLYVYQSSFTLAKPDMPFIESLLQNDLLEGDIDND